jgi:geranylgeranyl diphosphate synthase type I
VTFDERADRHRALIEREMRSIVGDSPASLFGWMRYHLGWEDADGAPVDSSPGKMLRPVGLLLACEVVGGAAERALPAAAAVELVHNFSLLHDDVEDRSERRRGRPTLWTFTSVAHAINTGDGMFALARLAMHRLTDAGVEPDRVQRAMRELDEACLRLVEGQYHDIDFEQLADGTLDEYLAMSAGKTAAMFAAPFAIGATLGGADAPTVDALRRFGHHVGLAFQGIDDVLGIWGDSTVTGKPVGDDIRTRKRTYPVLAAIEGGGDEAERLAREYAQPARPHADVGSLTDLIERLGGRAATERFAEDQRAAAQTALAALDLEASAQAHLEAYALGAAARVT